MAWFEITVLASAVVAVQADSEDEAVALAFAEAFTGADVGGKESLPAKLLSTAEEIDRSRRHCDIELPA